MEKEAIAETSVEDVVLMDYTVVSEWERFTAQLEAILQKRKKYGRNNDNWTEEILYKGAIIYLNHRQGKDSQNPWLMELGQFTGWNQQHENNNDSIRVARLFRVDSFFILQCGADTMLTLSTARLLLGSLLISSASTSVHSCFIVYGDGNMMGIDRGGKVCYSSIIKPLDEFMNYSQSLQLRDQVTQLLRYFMDRYFKSVNYTKMAFCYNLIKKDCPLIGDGLFGCAFAKCPFQRFSLQTIFPQLNFNNGNFPPPWDAPIWLFSARLDPAVRGGTAELLMQLGKLLKLAQSDLLLDSTRGYALDHRTCMRDLYNLGKKRVGYKQYQDILRRIFEEEEEELASPSQSFIAKLLTAIMLAFNEERINLRSNDQFAEVFTDVLGVFWNEFISMCMQHFNQLEYLSAHPSTPDLNSTLLEQKLAMLNYCIKEERQLMKIPGYETKKSVEETKNPLEGLAEGYKKQLQTRQESIIKLLTNLKLKPHCQVQVAEGEEDFFYDTIEYEEGEKGGKIEGEEEEEEEDNNDNDGNYDAKGNSNQKLVNTVNSKDFSERKGHKEMHPHLKLLNDNNIPLWIPFTQEAPPLTLDILHHWEQAATSGNASSLNTGNNRRKCAHLISDMEAFKAANPGCQFSDFVRWHSPKDWTRDGLSERMKDPNNLWNQLWKGTEAIPLVEQRLLFDPRREMKGIQNWLEMMRVREWLEIILPLMVELVTRRLKVDTTSESGWDSTLALINAAELKIAREEYIGTLLSPTLDYDKLIRGEPILIAQDGERDTLQTLFQGLETIAEQEMIINGPSQGLYISINPRSKMIEMALSEGQIT